jgi:3-methyladenine DNA glycosylase/8-oxoguanine DNA glycosylase
MTNDNSVKVHVPRTFSFLATVLGHGWHELPPFEFDENRTTLTRVEDAEHGGLLRFEDAGDAVRIVSADGVEWPAHVRTAIGKRAEQILALDVDLDGFAAAVEGKERYAWAIAAGFGRPLRSPSVWEDLAKTLLTTNTTWVVTRQMVTRLCSLGDARPDGRHTFPSPERIAGMAPEELEASARAGYRTNYLHELARRIAGGEIDPESWRSADMASSDMFKEIHALKGFGPYAAAAVMRLLGRHDYLAIDTSVRDVFRVQIAGGTPVTDREVIQYYDQFGRWKGLAAWADLMRASLSPILAPTLSALLDSSGQKS